ncbi:hypothetical protein PMI35_06603 [Pseudomonas sp. GM78]|uniref:hypothetical protein n=1 Tax=Pseudomonas sp. GM78 TaxID=1144337 RepID=UPI000270AABA|nr:hypothetical protein [Pseudomonas sp. GM78]EJN16855.1 hypothetical protein PMI35_06603 [Pseudomonas sp. GM78]
MKSHQCQHTGLPSDPAVVRSMLGACHIVRDRALIALSWSPGCTPDELASMECSDVLTTDWCHWSIRLKNRINCPSFHLDAFTTVVLMGWLVKRHWGPEMTGKLFLGGSTTNELTPNEILLAFEHYLRVANPVEPTKPRKRHGLVDHLLDHELFEWVSAKALDSANVFIWRASQTLLQMERNRALNRETPKEFEEKVLPRKNKTPNVQIERKTENKRDQGSDEKRSAGPVVNSSIPGENSPHLPNTLNQHLHHAVENVPSTGILTESIAETPQPSAVLNPAHDFGPRHAEADENWDTAIQNMVKGNSVRPRQESASASDDDDEQIDWDGAIINQLKE